MEPSYVVNSVKMTFTRIYRRLEKKIAREQRYLSRMKLFNSQEVHLETPKI